ncbi:MAG: hypothetical protein RLZZ339_779 [Cyanobacteriota bacterium]|jgi:hypothetical protein
MSLLYQVENQWGGDNAPWNNGGTWVMGWGASHLCK